MLTKKKIILTGSVFIAVIAMVIGGFSIYDYLNLKKVAKAAAGMPWQDGGKISMVRPLCILDTPAIAPTTCAISCPLVASALGPACVGYIELDTISQHGTAFLAVPVGFMYKGGGAFPTAGMQYIAGGASNVMPWVVGIPAMARLDKIKNDINFIIAGIRKL